MANPQPDRFVRVSQEYNERKNRAELGETERAVLDHVIGETWGYNRKAHAFTWAEIARSLGKARQNVERAGKALVSRRFLTEALDDMGRMTLGPQKDYDKWKPRAMVRASPRASRRASGVASRIEHHKEHHHDAHAILITQNKDTATPDAFGFLHDITAARAYPDPLSAARAGLNPETHAGWARLTDDERDAVGAEFLDYWRPILGADTRTLPDDAVAHLVAQLKSAAGGMPSYLSPEVGVFLAGALDRWRQEQDDRDERRRKDEREGQGKA